MSGPITEASNPITEEIDVASPFDIVSLLERCDAEIFEGYKDYMSLCNEETLATIANIAEHITGVLKDPTNGMVVLSGCGTSGRLGFIVARSFNELNVPQTTTPVFHYTLAGGDKALFTSQEAPEDDPRAGVESLKTVCAGKKQVVFVGITCGLSAPYVAGQLEYCMDHPDVFTPVLLGFNPIYLARNNPIETWNKTFLQVTQRLVSFKESGYEGYILNPVVGPEPITGSSRMKSGSATKILLEVICMKALLTVRNQHANWNVLNHIKSYNAVRTAVYKQKDKLSQVVELAGQSLMSGGRIYYAGYDSLALMGLIDASECPPTYGATLDDVRGFVANGYATLQNKEGDLTHLGKHFRISLNNMADDVVLNSEDILVLINTECLSKLPKSLASGKCKKVLLSYGKTESTPSTFDVILNISLDTPELETMLGKENLDICVQMLQEMATKWCLNAITTGAHILKGKVYRNIMIDVKVSNNKLFHRAVGILERLGHLSTSVAREYLLRSIYDTDVVTGATHNLPIAEHILTATSKDKVVPVALMAAVSKCTIDAAKLTLAKQPIIRAAIAEALKNLQ